METVKCRFCVDMGRYFFSSKAIRDDFLKKPDFRFDFQLDNVEDKAAILRIFGSNDVKPYFEGRKQNFIVTLLIEDEDNECGIIVSAELSMSFSIAVEIEEFRNWVESHESNWRYTGRIECVGECGIDSSDREIYEFD